MGKMSLNPSLRFPLYSESWKRVELNRFIDERKEKSKIQDEHEVLTSSRKGLITQREYYSDNERITERNNVGFNIIKPGDVTYRSRSDDRSFFFNINTLDRTGIISSYYPVFSLKSMDSYFFKSLSQINKYEIGAKSVGTSQTVLSLNELRKIKLNIPSLEEQQKIANFLSTVDKKINQLQEKHALIDQYKKGVMQKIFSQRIRFKDENGDNFPDWQPKVVGDFMTESRIKGNSGLIAEKITVKLWGKGVFEKNEKTPGSENTQYFQRKAGQFIYSKLDFLNCAFGLIPNYLNNFETTVDLPCFDISDGINKYLILELIKQKRFYKKYGDMADGSRKAKRIHAKDFLSFPINLPCEQEQNKIAEFLQMLDKKLELVSQQIEQTQTFKKGLLQKMFV